MPVMDNQVSENPVRRSDARPMRPVQTRRQTMRVMVFVKATDDSEKGILPMTEMLEAMGRYRLLATFGDQAASRKR
jgi:hypothetical protein